MNSLRIAAPLLLIALAGCASVDPYAASPMAQHLERQDNVGYCARLFADLDHRIDIVGVRDAEALRVEGFPYLRVDRLSAALAGRADNETRRSAWLARLAELDDTARAAELSNAALPADDLARCRVLLTAADAGAFEVLRQHAQVPDDYSTALRALGLYPLTQLPLAAGISQWRQDVRATFAVPLAALPVHGVLQRYAVTGAGQPVAQPVALQANNDALGVPVLSRFDRTALLLRHAPLLEIDVAGDHDRPGTPVLSADDQVRIDPSQSAASTRVTYTLLDGEAHVQLVYTFWFSERPATSALDPLAGRIDGLIWRVTLDRDGTPLVYDSIHPCGCYHLFFPTERVRTRPQPETLEEGLFVPQSVRAPAAGESIVLRIESGTHYLQRVIVQAAGPAQRRYRIDDERRLSSLERAGGGTRSAYGPDGLIPGSERIERHYLWISGIDSAGQMRQWGHHATAFVGRRHFDDPRLLDRYFVVPGERSAMHNQ
jgi:hypothetical protein